MSHSKSRKSDGAVVPFHFIWAGSTAASVASLLLNPTALAGVSSRLAAAADEWAHYRVLKLAFKVHPSGATNTYSVGFVGGVQDTPPALGVAIMELIPSVFMSASTFVPSPWQRISKSELAGPFPWYKALNGTADTTEEQPGGFYIAASLAITPFTVEVTGTYEFKTAVATSNTPSAVSLREIMIAERKNAELRRERDQLLRVVQLRPAAVPTETPAQSPVAGPRELTLLGKILEASKSASYV